MSTQPVSSVPEVHHLGRKPIEVVDAEAIVISEPRHLALQREPEEILAEASKAAKALKALIDSKEKKVVIGGKTFLQYEDWLTVARFYGISVASRATNYVERGRAQGYECHAEAILVSTGQVIGAAQAECLDDEERWNTRPVYEWRNGQRIKIGEEKVPLFQLRSMAQTRAESKVLASILRWVVVLAGYSGTPAEEMNEPSPIPSRAPIQTPPNAAKLPAKDVSDWCNKIATAVNFDELNLSFRAAYSQASSAHDQNAQAAYIAAKDRRRGELRRGHNGL